MKRLNFLILFNIFFLFFVQNYMLFSEESMVCPKCSGKGGEACKSCKEGMIVCSGRCIKEDTFSNKPVTKDGWINVIAMDQNNITRHTQCHRVHLGEILDFVDNRFVPKGKCPICSGTGKCKCKRCNGTCTILCSLCLGKKEVGKNKGNEYIKKQKENEKKQTIKIKMKDGKIIVGKKVIETKDKIGIKTEDGKLIMIPKGEIE